MRAGWDGELHRFYIVVYPEEAGAGLGNMSYRLKGGFKNGAIILTKPRQAPRAPPIPEINTPQSLESFMEEHNAWKARMRKWIDSKLPARKEVSP